MAFEKKGKNKMNFEAIVKEINPEEDYTVTEISRLTGLSYSCILAHVRRENLKSRKIFNKYYIKGRDIRNYLTGVK